MEKSKIKTLPMVEFSKMEYKRPDIEKYEKDMTALFKEFDEAKTAGIPHYKEYKILSRQSSHLLQSCCL